jgi:magnesium-transporting ATPase (P-type)
MGAPIEAVPGLDHPVIRPWHTLTIQECSTRLDTTPDGLSSVEAARRLAHYGPNEVTVERPAPWWKIAAHQFRDPLIYILLVAAAVTLLLSDIKDTVIITAVVIINGILGFIQEFRAQQAMHALARMSAPQAEVLRDGAMRPVPSRDLVPGDVVALASGVRVPADLRLMSANDLEVDESALTGESMPARKKIHALADEALVPGDQVNLAFAGTVVTRGRGRGFVARTGRSTELGRITTAVQDLGPSVTPLQEKMARFGKQIGIGVVGASLLVAVIDLLRGTPLAEIFMTAVAVAVAAVPESLPIILTITLAIGVRRMALRSAIVRSLPAVETLGSTTVIGSDKTGTLTKNEMTVRAIWTADGRYELSGAGYELAGALSREGASVQLDDELAVRDTLLVGVLANEADADAVLAGTLTGDPTEIALIVAATKAGLPAREIRLELQELDIMPFESDRRFMATLNVHAQHGRVVYMKGAPEVVLDRCTRQFTRHGPLPLEMDTVREAARSLGGEGLRVLAMAYRPTDVDRLDEATLGGQFIFAGLQAMEDPVRPEAVRAVAAAREAGIRVLMITGDHLGTAQAIGRQLGLGGPDAVALEGHQITRLSDAELQQETRRVDIYARVAPEHKLRLVRSLQAQGEIVAVTGDGVNDAPALRAADLGIAMGKGGTEVAREASDMVLADDNFATITAAVEEGRVVFSNIRKVTFFLLSTAVGMIFTILVTVGAGWPLPFLPAQILWINLVTNGLQDIALAFEPGEPGLLRRRPRPPGEGVITPRLVRRLAAIGVILAAGTLAIFWWVWHATQDLELARTAAMTQMVVFQFFHVVNSRSLDRSILSIPVLSNRFLFVTFTLAALAHLAAVYVPVMQRFFRTAPLDLEHWLVIIAVGTTVVLGGELDKWWNRQRGQPIG